MNQREVCEAFLRGEEAEAGPLWCRPVGRGAVLSSYGTPIAALSGRWAYVSESRHTATTAKHVARVTAALERAHSSVIVSDARLVGVLRRLGLNHFGRLA